MPAKLFQKGIVALELVLFSNIVYHPNLANKTEIDSLRKVMNPYVDFDQTSLTRRRKKLTLRQDLEAGKERANKWRLRWPKDLRNGRRGRETMKVFVPSLSRVKFG